MFNYKFSTFQLAWVLSGTTVRKAIHGAKTTCKGVAGP